MEYFLRIITWAMVGREPAVRGSRFACRRSRSQDDDAQANRRWASDPLHVGTIEKRMYVADDGCQTTTEGIRNDGRHAGSQASRQTGTTDAPCGEDDEETTDRMRCPLDVRY